MDGIHDLGGMDGFGEITVEKNEPTFHNQWEGEAFALNMVAIGILKKYNPDEYRHALERMNPYDYLHASYYERVFTGVASLLIEKGVISKRELVSKVSGNYPLARPSSVVEDNGKDTPSAAKFSVGDRVKVQDIHTPGHTRMPAYVRGHHGEIINVAPYFSFPDNAAHGGTLREEPTYHVVFTRSELWNDDEASSDTVVVDLWESYLEKVL
jgi:nitrile hydratase beta subunit